MGRLFVLSLVIVILVACERRGPAPSPEPDRVAPASTSAPARTCVPSRTLCGDDGPRRCNAQGTASASIARCAADRACRITKSGPACAVCDPAGVPTCQDDHTVVACTPDGALHITDCAAQKQRCVHGSCVARLCEPGRRHCHNGRLYQCNATGSDRVLVQDCFADGSGVCQPDVNPPACRVKCKAARGQTLVVAVDDCTCDWSTVPFCAEESEEGGCATRLCVAGGQLSAGATALPCHRETAGLVVPGSEKRGACNGDGEIGSMTIAYEVCRDGKAVAATRIAPCAR
ncbi:Hypothetical protein A7982_01694 [Minicystis rosea]|nr:Hypothetical protein A7982_01694 [Minicystis rosea]